MMPFASKYSNQKKLRGLCKQSSLLFEIKLFFVINYYTIMLLFVELIIIFVTVLISCYTGLFYIPILIIFVSFIFTTKGAVRIYRRRFYRIHNMKHLISLNRTNFNLESFKDYMVYPCDRIVCYEVLSQLGKSEEIRNLKLKFPFFKYEKIGSEIIFYK